MGSWQPLYVTGYLLNTLLFISAAYFVPSSNKLGLLLIALGVLSALVIISFPQTIVSPILLVVWVSFYPHVFSVKHAWFAWGLTNLVFLGLILLFKEDISSRLNTLSFIGFQLFSMVSTMAILRESKQKAELQGANLELILMQQLLQEKTKSEERLKIYRNLHDDIGQKLTALSLKIEHAKYRKPNNIDDFFSELKQEVSATLNQLRHIVKAARRQEQVDIGKVLKEVAAGIEQLTFTVHSPLSITSAELSEQLVYCLKEGISNALRHGKATEISLQVAEDDEQFTINLVDNGHFTNLAALECGSGLQGMQERLGAYAGKVQLLSNSLGGATLQLTLDNQYKRALA